jgi:hypothetical protein
VDQAWFLVNTYFMSTNALIAIVVLGQLGAYPYLAECVLLSLLSLATKVIYAGQWKPRQMSYSYDVRRLHAAGVPRAGILSP